MNGKDLIHFIIVAVTFNVLVFRKHIPRVYFSFSSHADYVGKSLGIIDQKESPTWEPFNQTNPHENSWCPNVQCQNSPICAPCNRRFLFILATGRSGSTSLLQMLNELPGVRMSGENDNILFRTQQMFFDMKKVLSENEDITEGPYMHNAISPSDMACGVQRVTQVLNPPPLSIQENANLLPLEEYDTSTIFGAKIIRIQKQLSWGPKGVARFFNNNFPCARFVINIRSDLETQLESIQGNFVKNGHVKNTTALNGQNERLQEIAHELGSDKARILDLSEWRNNSSVIDDLNQWLGFEGCKLKRLVHKNKHGYGLDGNKESVYGEECHYPHL